MYKYFEISEDNLKFINEFKAKMEERTGASRSFHSTMRIMKIIH